MTGLSVWWATGYHFLCEDVFLFLWSNWFWRLGLFFLQVFKRILSVCVGVLLHWSSLNVHTGNKEGWSQKLKNTLCLKLQAPTRHMPPAWQNITHHPWMKYVFSTGQLQPLMATALPDFSWTMRPLPHCKKRSEMAQGTWKTAKDVGIVSRFSISQSSWASIGEPRNSLIHWGSTSQATGLNQCTGAGHQRTPQTSCVHAKKGQSFWLSASMDQT